MQFVDDHQIGSESSQRVSMQTLDDETNKQRKFKDLIGQRQTMSNQSSSSKSNSNHQNEASGANRVSSMKAQRRRTLNEISTLRRRARTSKATNWHGHEALLSSQSRSEKLNKLRMTTTSFLAGRSLCHFAWSLGTLCLILIAAIVAAESLGGAQSDPLAGQANGQESGLNSASNNLQASKEQAGDIAVAASNNNYQQQLSDHQASSSNNNNQAGQKSKKIQIVYIKVPLSKLRPSLKGQSGDAYGANNEGNSSSTPIKGEQYETTADSKSQQQKARSQQQLNLNDFSDSDGQQRQVDIESGQRAGFQQAQSFLIPMAVVQTPQSNGELGLGQGDYELHNDGGRQQQPTSNELENIAGALGSAGSQLRPQHASESSPPTNRFRSPSMNLHEQNRQQLQQQQFARSAQPITHGFMSSFLLAEKEKMTEAALRLQKQRHQQQAAAATAVTPTAQVVTAASSAQQVSASSNSEQPTSSSSPTSSTTSSLNPKGPGGLMPSMIAPLSRMPDNAIGQAYGAAVGIALPTESGSPSSLLTNPSTPIGSYGGKQQQARSVAPSGSSNSMAGHGTNSGTSGEGAYSSGTGSSTSYGASGPNQQGSGSSGRNYQQLSQNSAATGPSSGYGNGISTSGASGAFSDYPAGSSSNSNYNHPQSDYQSQRLKQAKKTIIPIVVQVEHAVLENNNLNQNQNNYQQQQQQMRGGNRYGGRGNRQLDGKRGLRQGSSKQQQQIYGAATNEVAHYGDIPPGAQWVNAANAYDINQITAQINAENAASAAAALAQADAAFSSQSNHHSTGGPSRYPTQQRPSGGHSNGQSAYAAGLQSAASALLANTHPMIQAAASGGLASVSKLGAKLGEMIALPSMQMPSSIASIGSSLPSAFSSITNQMGAQLGQAVQQVAKEHPQASAFARQVAQQAGIQLPNFGQQQHQQSIAPGNNNGGQQASASNQHFSQLSPQAQLQNLKLSIGQNLQSAAATLIGVNQKANALGGDNNQLFSNANQMALSTALKQLSSISPAAAQLANQIAGGVQAAASNQQQTAIAPPASHETNGAQQGPMNALSQLMQQQAQVYHQLANFQQANQQPTATSDSSSGSSGPSSTGSLEASASSSKPTKSSTFKSKFLSFFQPPKFISNFLSWNDRADARNDKSGTGEMDLDLAAFADKLEEAAAAIAKSNATTTTTTNVLKTNNTSTTSQAPTSSIALANVTSTSTTLGAQRATSMAPPMTTGSMSTTRKDTPSATATSVGPTSKTTANVTTPVAKREKN